MRDAAGTLTHFVGFHRDVGERERAAGAQSAVGLPVWMREDRLTGLYTRNYFEELLRHDWQIARREERLLTVMMFDIDALEAYTERFGQQAADTCVRRLAGVINACFRRGSDLVARWESRHPDCAGPQHRALRPGRLRAHDHAARDRSVHTPSARRRRQVRDRERGGREPHADREDSSPRRCCAAPSAPCSVRARLQAGRIVLAAGKDFS